MAAVMTTTWPGDATPVGPAARPRAVRTPHARPVAPRRRRAAAVYRRRRLAVVGLALGGVVMAAQAAGGAHGGPTLAAPGRPPAVVTYVVQPGDTLWGVAERIAPGEDPRPTVDALVRARRGAPLVPGETIVLAAR